MKLLSRSLTLLIVVGLCNCWPLAAQLNDAMFPLRLLGAGAAVTGDFEAAPRREPGQINLSPVNSNSALHIEIIDGEGAINDIKGRVATDIIIQVEDRDHRPVAGAVVTLMSPSGGPSGTFSGGQHLVSLTTGRSGRVVVQGLHPNKITGKFQVQVTASFQGEIATGVITQTNLATAAAAAAGGGATAGGAAMGGGLSAGAIGAIVGGIAVAVGVGVGVFVAHSGHSPSVTSVSLAQPGSVSAGAPH